MPDNSITIGTSSITFDIPLIPKSFIIIQNTHSTNTIYYNFDDKKLKATTSDIEIYAKSSHTYSKDDLQQMKVRKINVISSASDSIVKIRSK